MMARESIGELINPELLIDGRLQEVHRDVELKQEGGKDGVSIEELSDVEESERERKRTKVIQTETNTTTVHQLTLSRYHCC